MRRPSRHPGFDLNAAVMEFDLRVTVEKLWMSLMAKIVFLLLETARGNSNDRINRHCQLRMLLSNGALAPSHTSARGNTAAINTAAIASIVIVNYACC